MTRKTRVKIPTIPHQVKQIPVEDLVHANQPYRTISPEAFADLKNSLMDDESFFLRRPCLINKLEGKLIIYAGNQKYDAAIDLGWDTVPCIVNELSKEDMETRMLKDNVHAGVFDNEFIDISYDKDFLSSSVAFDISVLGGDTIEKPENIVQQVPIDNKLYMAYGVKKFWVDEKTEKWMETEIKQYVDTTTTVYGFMRNLLGRFVATNAKI